MTSSAVAAFTDIERASTKARLGGAHVFIG